MRRSRRSWPAATGRVPGASGLGEEFARLRGEGDVASVATPRPAHRRWARRAPRWCRRRGALVVDLAPGRQQPSISADGRYVAFSTDEALTASTQWRGRRLRARPWQTDRRSRRLHLGLRARQRRHAGDLRPARPGRPSRTHSSRLRRPQRRLRHPSRFRPAAPGRPDAGGQASSAAWTSAARAGLHAPRPKHRRGDQRAGDRRGPAPRKVTISGDGSTVAWLTSGPAAAQRAVRGRRRRGREPGASVPLVRWLTDPSGGRARVITGKGDAEGSGLPGRRADAALILPALGSRAVRRPAGRRPQRLGRSSSPASTSAVMAGPRCW